MNLAIMQPYFFPYLGYFQLMASVDEWVVFDEIQFVNKGWVNRNRVLHPDVEKEWSYISLPLSGKSRFDRISEMTIADSDWRQKMRGQLSAFRKQAPYFIDALGFFDDCVEHDEKNLSSFLTRSLQRAAELLGLTPEFHVQSQAGWGLGVIEHPGQWALEISKVLGANRYLNPVGGRELFNEKEFLERDIELVFHTPRLPPYPQAGRKFVSGLSILDVLMWNGLEGTREYVRQGAHDFSN